MAQAPAASADSDVIVLHLLAWATCTMTLKHNLDRLACHLLHCDDVSGHFYNGHTCASHSHPAAVMGGSQLSASGNKQSCTLTLPEVSHGTQRLDCVYEWNSAGQMGCFSPSMSDSASNLFLHQCYCCPAGMDTAGLT